MVNPSIRWLTLLAALLGLAGCASQPRENPLDHPTPVAAAQGDEGVIGQQVQWGGVITAGGNRAEGSWLEVLAFPLNPDAIPLTNLRPRGRFWVEQPGYLELADYAPGRRTTVLGEIIGFTTDRIGEASYRFPILRATQMELWRPRQLESTQPPAVQFGIGVGLGF